MHKERATVLASWRWCTMLQPILAKTMPRAGKALCGHREEGAQRARRAVVRTKDERGVTVGRKALTQGRVERLLGQKYPDYSHTPHTPNHAHAHAWIMLK